MSRVRIFDPATDKPFQVSRTRVQKFLDCPRCFYIQNRLGVKDIDSYPFRLNSAVDTLLKNTFDLARAKQVPHEYFKKNGFDLVPFQHEKMDEWRENFKGIQYHHAETNLLLQGAVDDIVIDLKTKELSPIEFKASQTSDEKSQAVKYLGSPHHKNWKNQLEVYGYLLEKNGFTVSKMSYIVFCNGQIKAEEWKEKLPFDVQVVPYELDYAWVEPTLKKMKENLLLDKAPSLESSDECDVCRFFSEIIEKKAI